MQRHEIKALPRLWSADTMKLVEVVVVKSIQTLSRAIKMRELQDLPNIDVYWFPCNGSGNQCKSYGQQLAKLGETLRANSMIIGRIWVDIEHDSICNPWNYGPSGNLVQARALVSAATASGFAFGIYSSPDEWVKVFGSQSVVLANDVLLWFATYDHVESLDMPTPFGGWTTAFGKQYTYVSASGQFDINVFAA